MNDVSADDDGEVWPSAAERAACVAQARALRAPAAAGGLRFEAYLPPALATWLLDYVEQETFLDPSEAVFVMLGEQRDLEPHADLRKELMRRIIQAAIDDPSPTIPGEEVFARLKEKLAGPRPVPASWQRHSGAEPEGDDIPDGVP